MFPILLGSHLEVKLPARMLALPVTCRERPGCFPTRLRHFALPPARCEDSSFSSSSPVLVISHLFPYSHLVGVKWQLTEALICISLLVSDAEISLWASCLLWRNVSPIPAPALGFTVAAKGALHP